MCDINDCNAFLFKFLNLFKQNAYFRVGQCRRRFIHNDNRRIPRDRLGDFNKLLARKTKIIHHSFGGIQNTHLIQNLLCILIHFFKIHQPASQPFAARFAAEKNIFRNRHIGFRAKFLMNHRDSQFQTFGWRKIKNFPPLIYNRSGVRRVNPGNDFHKRGFTGAIFSDKRMYATCADRHVHILQNRNPGKTFFNILKFQYICDRLFHLNPSCYRQL